MSETASGSEDIREPHLRSRGDFLGVFAVCQRGDEMLFVANERRIDGKVRRVWDLPGGQVEPGELLHEALHRELREELCVTFSKPAELLFFQEGQRVVDTSGRRSARDYAWRSFFFAVDGLDGEPRAGAEVLDTAWLPLASIREHLDAPYHTSFLEWLECGRQGLHFQSSWTGP